MIIDDHIHPLVRQAQYVPDLQTVLERFFRPSVGAGLAESIRNRTLDDLIADMDAAGHRHGRNRRCGPRFRLTNPIRPSKRFGGQNPGLRIPVQQQLCIYTAIGTFPFPRAKIGR